MFQDLLNEWIKYWEEKYHEKIDMSQMGNAINFASWLDTRSPTLRAPDRSEQTVSDLLKEFRDAGIEIIDVKPVYRKSKRSNRSGVR